MISRIAGYDLTQVCALIRPGMFDHCKTIHQLDAEWFAIRAGIPKWHNQGWTRSTLACHRESRADQISGKTQACH